MKDALLEGLQHEQNQIMRLLEIDRRNPMPEGWALEFALMLTIEVYRALRNGDMDVTEALDKYIGITSVTTEYLVADGVREIEARPIRAIEKALADWLKRGWVTFAGNKWELTDKGKQTLLGSAA